MQMSATFPQLSDNMKPPRSRRSKPKGRAKVQKTMDEFETGTLHSGSKTGPKVTNRKQAVAIALSQQRKADTGGTGMGPLKSRPRPISAPSSLSGRRAASRAKFNGQ